MAENSYFHNGFVRGDSVDAPYAAELFHTVIKGIYTSEIGDGVIFSGTWTSDLFGTCSGADMDVDVASGSALVQGVYFDSDATETFTLSAVGGNARIDRIVIRVNWATQTARLALITGTASPAPQIPSLQQVFGEIWEFPLLRVHLTAWAAVVTQQDIFDERAFTNQAGAPPIVNIMHNSEFILGPPASYDAKAPAYWWSTGGTSYLIGGKNASYSSRYQERGRGVGVLFAKNGDTLETDIYCTGLSSTYYPDFMPVTIAFYAKVTYGRISISVTGGATVQHYLDPTDEPVYIVLRTNMSSLFTTLGFVFTALVSSGVGTWYDIYQPTVTFGAIPAKPTPKRETLIAGTPDSYFGSPLTRSTGSYTILPYVFPSMPDYTDAHGLWIMQRVKDSGSAGNDTIFASIGGANNVRTEVGRETNNVVRQNIGCVPTGPFLNSTIPISVTASGAGTLVQHIKLIGCET